MLFGFGIIARGGGLILRGWFRFGFLDGRRRGGRRIGVSPAWSQCQSTPRMTFASVAAMIVLSRWQTPNMRFALSLSRTTVTSTSPIFSLLKSPPFSWANCSARSTSLSATDVPSPSPWSTNSKIAGFASGRATTANAISPFGSFFKSSHRDADFRFRFLGIHLASFPVQVLHERLQLRVVNHAADGGLLNALAKFVSVRNAKEDDRFLREKLHRGGPRGGSLACTGPRRTSRSAAALQKIERLSRLLAWHAYA